MTLLREHRRLYGSVLFAVCCVSALLYASTNTLLVPGIAVRFTDETGSLAQALYHRQEQVGLSLKQAEMLFFASRAWTAKPHYAGSTNDYTSALELLRTFQSHLGIDPPQESMVFESGSPESRQATLSIPNSTAPTAWIDTYYPWIDTPGERRLEILNDDGSVLWSADLEEKAEEGDPAGEWHDTLGAWHALSKAGDVRGKLFFAGSGWKGEFDDLVAAGHNLTGKIALVKAAQEAGAIGCIEYNDAYRHAAMIENGYKPWPAGPGFNSDSVERGSVQFLSLYPGDPTTPGKPSYRHANRTEPLSVPAIPSLPISHNNGKVLLEQFEDGAVFSKRQIRLVNTVHNKLTPIWNTMAVIPGHVQDEIVIIGNHRDAWVLGAGDPTSGTVSIHEVVKGLGALLKQGWRPLRTIMIASWDAEEYGLIGSTEWGEDFPEFIQKHVVAYMNVDSSAAGERYWLRGSPILASLLQQTAEELPHPLDQNRTLWDATIDRGHLSNHSDSHAQVSPRISDSRVDLLGSGSDYTVFLQRFGIPCMDESFRNGYNSPVWHRHSVWDSEKWMETYGDPGFHRHVAVAKHLGLVLLRLANQAILPFNTTQYAVDLQGFLNKVEGKTHTPGLKSLEFAIKKVQQASKALDGRKERAAVRLEAALRKETAQLKDSQPRKHYPLSHRRLWSLDQVPPAPFSQATFEKPSADRSTSHELADALSEIKAVNKVLSTFEQGFISEEGLPGREWYRHLGIAPGRWTGYGATVFPALNEAVTLDKNSTLATYEAERLTRLLESLADRMS